MVSDKILIFSLFVGSFYRKGPALKVNSREKTRKVRENWSQQLEHAQVPERDRFSCLEE